MAKILIVDDHANTLLTLGAILRREGHSVVEANCGRGALEAINLDRFQIVITDLKLGDIDGIEVLTHTRRVSPGTEVIVITAFGSVLTAVRAMKLGAFDYITKPLDRDRIISLVGQVLNNSAPQVQPASVNETVAKTIVGESVKMLQAIELAKKVAQSDMPVLITGESGTGKELIANYIHKRSARGDMPFLAINCGALPESLQESELFGHVKGAFTNALARKKGLFEEADKGTVLLDEVGEMSLSTQVKLLRALQDGEIRPVGGNKTVHVDVRVISSTNLDLSALVAARKFRDDLLFRINAFSIALPPLRQRREDIAPLVRHFISKHGPRFKKKVAGISPEALSCLENHDWPGNVRELENCISRAVMLSSHETIQASDLEQLVHSTVDRKSQKLLIEQEKALIIETLKRMNWNQKLAAAELGIGITTLWRKIKKFGLKRLSDPGA